MKRECLKVFRNNGMRHALTDRKLEELDGIDKNRLLLFGCLNDGSSFGFVLKFGEPQRSGTGRRLLEV